MGDRARVLKLGVWMGLALLAIAAAGAVPAAAKTCYKTIVPPGESGTSQYVEVIPTACGSATPPSSGAGRSGSSGGSAGSINRLGHGAAGVKSLSHLGAEGKAAAALAAATAPPLASSQSGAGSTASTDPKSSRQGVGRSGATTKLSGLPSVTGSSAGALGDALAGTGSDGLGIVLPLLLGVLFGAAVVAGAARARRGSGPSA
jgi:hypothetical protein